MRAAARALALGLALAVSAGSAVPQGTPPVVKGPMGASVDEYLARCVPFGFSGSVALAKDGKLLLLKGYGCADRKTGAACTPDTIFDLGSLSQQFTASLVLVLEQRGLLRVTDPIGVFLKDVPEDKGAIRIQHLLAHSSGLPRELSIVPSDTYGHGDYRQHDLSPVPVTMDDRAAYVRTAMNTPLEFQPGERRSRSNIDYVLLAAIVEAAAKMPFEQALRELVLEPAELEHTGVRKDGHLDASLAARGCPEPDLPPPEGSILETDPERFTGHGDERLLATDGWYSWAIRGAGGVLTTAADLWKWEQLLETDALLTAASRKKLYTYAWYEDDPPRWFGRVFHWDSTGNGFDAMVDRRPREHLFMAMLSNVADVAHPVGWDIARAVPYGRIDLPPATVRLAESELRAWCGDFAGPGGEEFRVRSAGAELLLQPLDEVAFQLLNPNTGNYAEHPTLLARSREIVTDLARADFTAFHAVQGARLSPLFIEEHWPDLIEHHGPMTRAYFLGEDGGPRESTRVWFALDFQRGSEILELRWRREPREKGEYSKEWLGAASIGPPYTWARVHFVPESATSAVTYPIAYGRDEGHATLVVTETATTLDVAMRYGGSALLTRK